MTDEQFAELENTIRQMVRDKRIELPHGLVYERFSAIVHDDLASATLLRWADECARRRQASGEFGGAS